MTPEEHQKDAINRIVDQLDEAEKTDSTKNREATSETYRANEVLAKIAASYDESIPPPPHVWAAIRGRVTDTGGARCVAAGAIPRESHTGKPGAPVIATVPPAQSKRKIFPIFWPIAAALLLALNLAQWVGNKADESSGETGGPSQDSSQTARHESAGTIRDSSEQTDVAQSSTPGVDEPDSGGGTRFDEQDPAAASLYATDQQDPLEATYALDPSQSEIVESLIPALTDVLLDMRRGTIWTAELRSATQGQEQRSYGLWEMVKQIAPEQGIAMITARSGVEFDPTASPDAGDWQDPTPGFDAIPNPSGRESVPAEAPTAAIAVLNDAEGLGYLDVHNLPEIPAGQSMQLWLQRDGDQNATLIGAVPNGLAGTSGTMVFRYPQSPTSPNQILVTIEPTVPGQQPTGPVLIQGP